MKKVVTVVFLLFLGMQGFGQTKLIAHKSHGGTRHSFRADMEHFDMKDSNFGLPFRPSFKLSMDTIDYVSDSMIVVSGAYCYTLDTTYRVNTKDTLINSPLFKFISPVFPNSFWSSSDTVLINIDSLFDDLKNRVAYKAIPYGSLVITADSLVVLRDTQKNILEREIDFSTIKKETSKEKKNVVPAIISLPSPPNQLKWMGLLVIFVLAVLVGLWNKMSLG